MAKVVFSAGQRSLVDGLEEIEVDARRVADLIRALDERFPRLRGRLDDLAVAIDGDIHQNAKFVPLEPDSEVHFIGAIAGGSGTQPERAPAIDPLEAALSWHRAGHGVALATVLETWGSSPCPAGSLLAVSDSGDFAGSVSGGCVESSVIEAAQELLPAGPSRILEFDVSNEAAWDVGLACGGRVTIRIEPID